MYIYKYIYIYIYIYIYTEWAKSKYTDHQYYTVCLLLVHFVYIMYFFVQHLSETFFILKKTDQYTIKNLYRSVCTVPVILVKFS